MTWLETPASPQTGKAGVTSRGSDAELPACLSITVTPCWTAGHRVLQCADRLAATCAEETHTLDGDNFQALVIGALKRHNGLLAENFREVFLEQLSFLSSQEEESGRFLMVALGANEV